MTKKKSVKKKRGLTSKQVKLETSLFQNHIDRLDTLLMNRMNEIPLGQSVWDDKRIQDMMKMRDLLVEKRQHNELVLYKRRKHT